LVFGSWLRRTYPDTLADLKHDVPLWGDFGVHTAAENEHNWRHTHIQTITVWINISATCLRVANRLGFGHWGGSNPEPFGWESEHTSEEEEEKEEEEVLLNATTMRAAGTPKARG